MWNNPVCKSPPSRRLRRAWLALGLLAAAGCSGSDEPFSETPGSAPPGAPKTGTEYDEAYPADPDDV